MIDSDSDIDSNNEETQNFDRPIASGRPERKRKIRPPIADEWAVFHFHSDNSLFRVPRPWISKSQKSQNDQRGTVKYSYNCWWPKDGSEDEKNVSTLISRFSEPDRENWIQLRGRLIGVYTSLEAAERELKRRDGTLSTDHELDSIKSKDRAGCGRRKTDAQVNKEEVKKLIALGRESSKADAMDQTSRMRSSVTNSESSRDVPRTNPHCLSPKDSSLGIPSNSPHSQCNSRLPSRLKPSNSRHSCTDSTRSMSADCSSPEILDASWSPTDFDKNFLSTVCSKLDEMKENQTAINRKLDQILLQRSKHSVDKEECYLEESGKPYTISIERMASSKPEVREKVNAIRCLQDLGFPVKSSIEELTERNQMLTGSDTHSIQRRNALANSLMKVVPELSRRTVANSVRLCLYAMAPSALWQFYSGQGMSGSNKLSFTDNLPMLSKAVILAVSEVTKVEQPTVLRFISDVLKSMHTRRSAAEYRRMHPLQVKEIMGSDDNTVFAKKRRQDHSDTDSHSTLILSEHSDVSENL